jgi:hypothetical protein
MKAAVTNSNGQRGDINRVSALCRRRTFPSQPKKHPHGGGIIDSPSIETETVETEEVFALSPFLVRVARLSDDRHFHLVCLCVESDSLLH